MKVALIQTELTWEDPEQNRSHLSSKIRSIAEAVDLIVLPEMFTSGFTMNPKNVAEPAHGKTVQWLLNLAQEKQTAICGSVVVEEENKFYNRLFFVLPSGVINTYDKRHLFTLAGEDEFYTAGSQRLIIDYKGFRICPLICYDLRFPVFSRNTEAYDLLIYVANWPKVRVNAWDILLPARAVENMSYAIGVNRIGIDTNGHHYSGHSQIVDCLGNYVLQPQEGAGIFIQTLDRNALHETRKKLAFLDDQDQFTVLD